jgi:outer membrane protein assembly factor BamB
MNRRKLSRRAALALPLAAGGCAAIDDLFTSAPKPKLPGEREPVISTRRGLDVDSKGAVVSLPPVAENPVWLQAGGNVAHDMGHLQIGDPLAQAWTSEIGEGGGYRAKLLAQPVVSGRLVCTMDSDAAVRAFDTATGARAWSFETKDPDVDSTNIGGGLGIEADVLYASNGLGDVFALKVGSGERIWHRAMPGPTRSDPTIADGRLFITTIDDKLFALSVDDGRTLWSHQAPTAATSLLGQPAPAYADGIVVGGFGSGELAALRADSGGVAWTDSLASIRGRNSIADLSAIRGRPAIVQGRLYAIGLGGLMVAIDLRSGRRLWEREVAGEDSIWAAGDWLFVIARDQRIAAVNRNDGRVAWVTQLPPFADEEEKKDAISWFGPLLAGGRLIVAGTANAALSVNAVTGEIVGRQELAAPASFGPVAAGGTVYIVTDDGMLTAFR